MLPLPYRSPIDPHSPHLPVLFEQHSVGHVSRLEATEPVVHAQDASRDGGGGLDCRDGGQAHVLYGAASGVVTAGSQWWTQDVAEVEGIAETGDGFGSSLAAGDFGKSGQDDLVVGVRLEDVNGAIDAGLINVLYGQTPGITVAGDQLWTQDTSGVQNNAERDDQLSFGGLSAA